MALPRHHDIHGKERSEAVVTKAYRDNTQRQAWLHAVPLGIWHRIHGFAPSLHLLSYLLCDKVKACQKQLHATQVASLGQEHAEHSMSSCQPCLPCFAHTKILPLITLKAMSAAWHSHQSFGLTMNQRLTPNCGNSSKRYNMKLRILFWNGEEIQTVEGIITATVTALLLLLLL